MLEQRRTNEPADNTPTCEAETIFYILSTDLFSFNGPEQP